MATKLDKRIVSALFRTSYSKTLQHPLRCEFDYRGMRCVICRGLLNNQVWIGALLLPLSTKWPRFPEIVTAHEGVDFDFDYQGKRILGFHCGHLQDYYVGLSRAFPGATLKTFDYVVTQVKDMVDQLTGNC